MYEEIENIIVRTLSPFEYEKLELLKQDYTEQQIVDIYKNSPIKNINYITRVLQNKFKNTPKWLNQEVKNEEIDENTKKEYNDFNKFIEDFRK